MPQELSLQMVTRDDVTRIKRWLEDEEVSESWFGRYAYGDPAHLGYHPNEMDEVSDEEWDAVFDNPEHRMLSIYSPEAGHIGEVHLAIEESLGDGQLSIPDRAQGPLASRLWLGCRSAHPRNRVHRVRSLPRLGGHTGVQHRSPQHVLASGLHAMKARCARAGPHEGSRFDSVIMGLLANEYVPLDGAAIQEIPRV